MPTLVLTAFLIFFTIEFVLERVLSVLNAWHVRAHGGMPPEELKDALPPEFFPRSVEYTLARTRFGHVSAAWNALFTLLYLFSGLIPWLNGFVVGALDLQGGSLTHGVAFLVAFSLINTLAHLPLQLYSTFKLEARFGFNKMDLRTFFLDKLKGLMLGAILGIPFLYALLAFMAGSGPLWWLWASLFVIGFQFLMRILHPLVITPLFNKFTPLEPGELKERLEALARDAGFATRGIFVMDGSKRSAHSNAYLTGIGRAHRIVLFDTLIQQLNVAELAAVLAHEIGHYKKKHIQKMLLVLSLLTVGGFYVLSLLINWRPLYEAFGISTPSLHVGLLLFSLLAGYFTFWVEPLFNLLSRKHEYEAAAYAAAQTRATAPMETALVKLHEKNLSPLTPHPAYSAYHYSHPTLLERIRALRNSGF